MVVIDFETEAIDFGSGKAPYPVSVAIKWGDAPAEFYAWGHPEGNNCTFDAACHSLREAWESGKELIFHNAKFDIAVATQHFALQFPHDRVHDTMIMAYLHNPREPVLGLKDLADKYLDMPAEEQDELHDWILANVKKATKKTAGAYISLAPGELVGRYAIGDVDRTWGLYKFYKGVLDEELAE